MALYWKKEINGKSFNTLLNNLSIVFRLFLKEDDPFRNIPKKSGMSQEHYPFSIEQLKAIWTLLSSEDFYLPDKEGMKVLYILALNTIAAETSVNCAGTWSIWNIGPLP